MNLYLVTRKEFPCDCCVRAKTLAGAVEVYNSAYSSGETVQGVKFMTVDGPLNEVVSNSALQIGGLLLETLALGRIASDWVDRQLGLEAREEVPAQLEDLCYQIRTQVETMESKLKQAKEFLDLVISRADLEK